MEKIIDEVIKKVAEKNYDSQKMKLVVVYFVRFLVGSPDVAVSQLKMVGNPSVKPPPAGSEYNKVYNNLYSDILKAITKNLG